MIVRIEGLAVAAIIGARAAERERPQTSWWTSSSASPLPRARGWRWATSISNEGLMVAP